MYHSVHSDAHSYSYSSRTHTITVPLHPFLYSSLGLGSRVNLTRDKLRKRKKHYKYINKHHGHIQHRHNRTDFKVYLVSTVGFNSSYMFIPYFVEWYKTLGIKPEHFLLNIHVDEHNDDMQQLDTLLDYLHASNITNYNLWKPEHFTSNLKKESEIELINKTVTRYDYILITDIDELQDWRAYGVDNLYDFILTQMIPFRKEYVTGYLVDRFAHNATLMDPDSTTHNVSDLFTQYPFECDFTEKIVEGIIDKVCLYRNVYTLNGGGRHSVKKRLYRYRHQKVHIEHTGNRLPKGAIRGNSIFRFPGFRLKIHHFKWKANVIEYLQARAILYKEQGIVWWIQSQNAVNWLVQNVGHVDLENV
eukprot:387307_1